MTLRKKITGAFLSIAVLMGITSGISYYYKEEISTASAALTLMAEKLQILVRKFKL